VSHSRGDRGNSKAEELRTVGRAGVTLTQEVVDTPARKDSGPFNCLPVDYNNAS